ncbi:MAG: 3-dehydroquinate synthase [Candidatus Zapsychrus exili]|nr:3-dehydroquinate synthase [Candidatus Zapsychrus exili]
MEKVRLALKENSYDIIIGSKILSKLGCVLKSLNIGQDAIIVTNPVIYKHYGKTVLLSLKKHGFTSKVFSIPSGEKSKSAKVAFDLMGKIANYDVLKKPFIIALGGGVVGDLAGYLAASYKRGIPYVQVPTTLLAQLDSAIGGKVAIDLPVGKNLIGAFYQPKVVFSDVSTLSTLSKRQMLNGLSEAIKYGIIYDKNLFYYIEKNYKKLIGVNSKALTEVVLNCSKIKAKVVSSDEKETKGLRTILNFGHTVGHAIEAGCKYDYYNHGEAVALGMRVAVNISVNLGMLKSEQELLINDLLSKVGLPQKIKNVSLGSIIQIMKHDKKFISKKNRFVLATKIGKVKVEVGIPEDVIKQAVRKFLNKNV